MKRYFGSKLPIINIIVSNVIFITIKYRLEFLKLKNRIKSFFNKESVKLINDSSTQLAFEKFYQMGYDKINVGGGPYGLDGFINLDFVFFSQVERQVQANILDLSFIRNNSLSHIYSNQLLEHLSESQLIGQFNQYNKLLKEDGTISFRTPNALGVSYGFWFGQVPEDDYEGFLNAGYPSDAFFFDSRDGWYHKDLFALLHWWYADTGNIKNEHLSQFTPTSILSLLSKTGFEVIKMTKPETSQIIIVAKKKK